MLRHAVYFETLAKIQDESSPEWRSTFAGLVVLRLVDDWLAFGTHVVTTDVTGLHAIREAIAEVADGDPARRILTGAVDVIQDAETANIGVLVPQLLAYGNTLVYSNALTLAIDVFELVLAHTRGTPADASSAIDAVGRLAYARRRLRDLDGAHAAYTLLQELAVQTGDEVNRVNAELGFARLAQDRGDLARAETMLDAIISATEAPELQEPHSVALHERGYVALQRGQYEVGIRYAYRSLQLSRTPAYRDYTLNNLAAMFLGLGSWRVSRDVFLIIEATAQERHMQSVAKLNLFEIAALYGTVGEFRSYYHQLQTENLTPPLRGDFFVYASSGYVRFGELDKAREHLEAAIELANEKKLHELLFRAEKLLSELDHLPMPTSFTPSTPTPVSVRDIATALTNLRELAHAGA